MSDIRLTPLPRAEATWWHAETIRHVDLDSNNHVNNTVICTWFGDGRYSFVRAVLGPLMEAGDYPVLVSMRVDFLAEVMFGDHPEVATSPASMGRSSVTTDQTLYLGDRPAAVCRSAMALLGGTTRRAKPLTNPMREALASLMPHALATALIGELDKGWDYAKFLLTHERTNNAQVHRSRRELERLADLANNLADSADVIAARPDIRLRLEETAADLAAVEMTVLRVLAEEARAWAERHLFRRVVTIYAGANEVQRTIMARTALGM